MSVMLRPMQRADLPACFSLTQKLRWSHRQEDWQEAYQLGEAIVAVASDGEVIGSIFFWRWGTRSASIGLVIVDERFQGQGIGKRLMMAVLEKLEGVDVRLHATEMGKGLYARLGFAEVGNIHQFQIPALEDLQTSTPGCGVLTRKASLEDLVHLAQMDTSASGMARENLIAHLYEHHHLEVAISPSGQIVGFAARRKFGHGWAIGPVVAESQACAQWLIAGHLRVLTGEFVRIDTASDVLRTWLEAVGFKDVDAPVTMIRGTSWAPPTSMETFGLMTQAMA